MASFPVLAATATPTSGFAGWAVEVMDRLGAIGAGLIIALENVFPPLPSEAVLPLAGFTASTGDLGLVAVLVATTVGSVVGALVLYGLGRWLGRDRLRSVVARVPLLSVSDVDRAEAWFARRGNAAVLLGRMVPVVRSVISIPAGVQRMPVPRFLALTALGSAIWNAVFVLAGYALGAHWSRIDRYAGLVEKGVLVLIVLAVAGLGARRWSGRRRGQHSTR